MIKDYPISWTTCGKEGRWSLTGNIFDRNAEFRVKKKKRVRGPVAAAR
jgi:hypothetical protein